MWWSIVVVVLVVGVGVYGFTKVVGWNTRMMSRRGSTSLEESYWRNRDAPKNRRDGDD